MYCIDHIGTNKSSLICLEKKPNTYLEKRKKSFLTLVRIHYLIWFITHVPHQVWDPLFNVFCEGGSPQTVSCSFVVKSRMNCFVCFRLPKSSVARQRSLAAFEIDIALTSKSHARFRVFCHCCCCCCFLGGRSQFISARLPDYLVSNRFRNWFNWKNAEQQESSENRILRIFPR